MAEITREQIKKVLLVVQTVADLIKSLGSVPSGELYAQLMPTGLTLNEYNTCIDFIERAKLITVKNHLITWVGPK
jgi:hypothetical protein